MLRLVQHGNNVIMTGGQADIGPVKDPQKLMLRLSCLTIGCTWETMTTELAVPRIGHISVVVPANFVNCP